MQPRRTAACVRRRHLRGGSHLILPCIGRCADMAWANVLPISLGGATHTEWYALGAWRQPLGTPPLTVPSTLTPSPSCAVCAQSCSLMDCDDLAERSVPSLPMEWLASFFCGHAFSLRFDAFTSWLLLPPAVKVEAPSRICSEWRLEPSRAYAVAHGMTRGNLLCVLLGLCSGEEAMRTGCAQSGELW